MKGAKNRGSVFSFNGRFALAMLANFLILVVYIMVTMIQYTAYRHHTGYSHKISEKWLWFFGISLVTAWLAVLLFIVLNRSKLTSGQRVCLLLFSCVVGLFLFF